jgi:hypothetical protein
MRVDTLVSNDIAGSQAGAVACNYTHEVHCTSLILPLLAAALLQCGDSSTALPGAELRDNAVLSYENGALHIENDAERILLDEGRSYRSFTVNEAAGCLVLTSLDDDLLPDSWVLGPQREVQTALHLPGQVMEYKSAGYLAFAGMPDPLLEFGSELSIVNRSGKLVLEAAQSWLLSAQLGSNSPDEALLMHWQELGEYSELFSGLSFQLVSTLDGGLIEEWTPEMTTSAADVELLYLDEQVGLLLVQYDIYTWQVLQLERSSGMVREVFSVEGQPMYDRLLPSGMDILSHLELVDGKVELDVISFAEGNLRISIDPHSAVFTQGQALDTVPGNQNQDIVLLDNRGSGLGLKQQLFPLTIGTKWKQDAYLDQGGKVLLLSESGPSFMKFR